MKKRNQSDYFYHINIFPEKYCPDTLNFYFYLLKEFFRRGVFTKKMYLKVCVDLIIKGQFYLACYLLDNIELRDKDVLLQAFVEKTKCIYNLISPPTVVAFDEKNMFKFYQKLGQKFKFDVVKLQSQYFYAFTCHIQITLHIIECFCMRILQIFEPIQLRYNLGDIVFAEIIFYALLFSIKTPHALHMYIQCTFNSCIYKSDVICCIEKTNIIRLFCQKYFEKRKKILIVPKNMNMQTVLRGKIHNNDKIIEQMLSEKQENMSTHQNR